MLLHWTFAKCSIHAMPPIAYGGTAASSPVPHDDRTPEPDIAGPPAIPSASALPTLEDISLEGVPLPVYPLPSKPFPVQPPQKIGSGLAPIIPLDKSGKQVRRWRQVNREIRGIAGGRWFVRTWAGEKESEFATAAAASAAALHGPNGEPSALGLSAASFSRLSSISASTPGKPGPKSKAAKAEAASSTLVSRSGSLVPDSISAQISKRNGSVPGTVSAAQEGTPNPLPSS